MERGKIVKFESLRDIDKKIVFYGEHNKTALQIRVYTNINADKCLSSKCLTWNSQIT